MKKIFFLLLSSLTCLFAFTLLGHSQTSKKEFADNYYSVLIKKEKQFLGGHRNDVPTQITRDFENKFENVDEVKWVVDDNETTAYFVLDGVNAVTRYNNDGEYISTSRTYTADKLPKQVARFLKSAVKPDFTPYLVTELRGETNTLYVASLQNNSSWRILTILKDDDGVLSIIDEKFLKKA
jgi:hypothetical protein